MVNNFCRASSTLDTVYSIEDLTKLQCSGDKHLHNFRHRWNVITGNMIDKLQDKSLENILVSKLVSVRELSEDLAHYYRAAEGSADVSYQYLRARIDACLERRQQKQNREEMSKSLAGQQQAQAALTAQEKKKAKDKPDGAAPKAAPQPNEGSGDGPWAAANPAVTQKGGKDKEKVSRRGKLRVTICR